LRATVTPVRSVPVTSGQTDANGDPLWLPVAWIWVEGNPSRTKYGEAPDPWSKPYWGMHSQLNLLEVAYDSKVTNPKERWQGRITQLDLEGKPIAAKVPRRVLVRPENHDFKGIPSTARFHWKDTDEGVWIPCDQGCCRVDAFYE
jgi:hypothetical protein